MGLLPCRLVINLNLDPTIGMDRLIGPAEPAMTILFLKEERLKGR
jgi:hypothetical protein